MGRGLSLMPRTTSRSINSSMRWRGPGSVPRPICRRRLRSLGRRPPAPRSRYDEEVMRFPYLKIDTDDPVFPLGGITYRFRPIIPIGIIGPSRTLFREGTLDSGADDTVFPASWAMPLGIDLTRAPLGKARAANGTPFVYRYAEVGLQLTIDGNEKFAWKAIVGFSEARKTRGLLGDAGLMEYFDVAFFGERREVIVTPNSSFHGEWAFRHRPPEVTLCSGRGFPDPAPTRTAGLLCIACDPPHPPD